MTLKRSAPKAPKIPRSFYILTLLVYLPIFYCLAVIRAKWFGFVIAWVSLAALLWFRHHVRWSWLQTMLSILCAFVVAFGGLYFSRPRWDVSLPGQVGTGTLHVFVNLPVDEEIKSGDVLAKVELWSPPEGYSYEIIDLTSSKLEALRKEGSTSQLAVLQLHGGAFVSGLNSLYRTMAERFSAYAGDAAVFTLDYRLAPAYPYPSQQNDVMDAWHYLTQTLGYRADQIIVTGDSAGGNLVLNLGLRLRDENQPMPLALIGFSPWADLSNSGSSHITNATKDPTFGIEPAAFDGVTPVGVNTTYPDELNAQDPYVSPSFGDYAGFPPMLLQAGELEVLLSDSQMVYDNALSHGVDCTLTIYPGMFHVFQGSLDLLPESKEAWKEVEAFIHRVAGLE